ncbi:MAG: protein-disulfide isomerase [Cellvibrionaceae bacterium]|jgi:protein-disulfide isomerase
MAKSKSEKKQQGREAKKAKHRLDKRNQQISSALWIGLPILFVVGLIAFGLVRQANQPPFDPLAGLKSTNIDGNSSAPVTVIEFGDFDCPACRQWHRSGIKQQVQAEFGDEVRFVFRHFPVINPVQSPIAAEAAQCAADQDRFWDYHDFLYERANGLSVDQLKGYSVSLGLDASTFNSCLDSREHRQYVSDDKALAVKAGARGTPTFMVNGQIIASPSLGTMISAIRAAQ